MVSDELMRRAKRYLAARKAQELDHTNQILDDVRTETHDALMMQMDIEGVKYTSREHTAQIAQVIVAGGSIAGAIEQREAERELSILQQQVEQLELPSKQIPFTYVESQPAMAA
ncbi:MAG: hypothetical protein U9R15_13050, partial [Chloroflexota bacterium]|nr:hypothetical protein [Chloroflexota bacterium]